MIKKTATILLPLLCFTAQYAEAFKITAKRAEAPVSSSYTTLWFILAFGGGRFQHANAPPAKLKNIFVKTLKRGTKI